MKPHAFVTQSRPRRRPSSADLGLLDDVLDGVDGGPVRERQIRDSRMLYFGRFDPADQAITLNVPLMRVAMYLHEGTHRARPDWDERTVRSRSAQLLQLLDDDAIGDLNAQLLAAIRG